MSPVPMAKAHGKYLWLSSTTRKYIAIGEPMKNINDGVRYEQACDVNNVQSVKTMNKLRNSNLTKRTKSIHHIIASFIFHLILFSIIF